MFRALQWRGDTGARMPSLVQLRERIFRWSRSPHRLGCVPTRGDLLAFALGALVLSVPVGAAPGQTPDRSHSRALRRQIEQRFLAVVKRELQLTDDQSRQFQQIVLTVDQRRSALMRDEAGARSRLRDALSDTTSEGEQVADRELQRIVGIQHTRAAILEDEQNQLKAFLTPRQRAKYVVLEEWFNRQIDRASRPAP
jgi:hypothetical protein